MSGSAQNVTAAAGAPGGLALAQRARDRAGVVLSPDVPLGVDLDVDRGRQRVHHRDADAVQPAGDGVGVAVELAARVQHRHDDLDRGPLLHRVHADRDAAAVVDDPHPAVVLQHDLDAGGVARHRLVDGVVHDLPDQVVQPALAGGPDVHAGALADRLQPLEDRDRRCAVGVLLGSHGQPVSSTVEGATTRCGDARRPGGCHNSSGSPAPAHTSMILVRADRSARRTPLASPLTGDPDQNRDRPADRGVATGGADVTARCTAV